MKCIVHSRLVISFSTASCCSCCFILWYWLFPVYFQVSPISVFFHIQHFCLFCPNQVTEKNLWTLHLPHPSPPTKTGRKKKKQMHWPRLTQVFSTHLKKSFKDLVSSKSHLFSVAIPTLNSYFPTHFGSLHVLDFCRKYAGSVDIRS